MRAGWFLPVEYLHEDIEADLLRWEVVATREAGQLHVVAGSQKRSFKVLGYRHRDRGIGRVVEQANRELWIGPHGADQELL